MLTSCRDAGLATTRFHNVIDEARKRRDAANEEGNHSTPVGSPFLRVAVDAVEVVHVRNGDFAAAEDIVARERLDLIYLYSIIVSKR